MAPFIGVGFVALISLMGVIDTRHTRRRLAKALGAFAIVAAALAAGAGTWLALTGAPLDPWHVPVLCSGPVLGGLVADVLADLRTRSFPASVTVTAFAMLLPNSTSDAPTAGAVFFVAAICVLLGSVIGALARRVAGLFLFRDEDEDDDDDDASPGGGRGSSPPE